MRWSRIHLDYLIPRHFGHSSEDRRKPLLIVPPVKKPMQVNYTTI